MAKSAPKTTITVRDARTGRLVTVRGAGALKNRKLPIRNGIDLTKPIAAQASADQHH